MQGFCLEEIMKDFIQKSRSLWRNLSNHEKILFLNYMAKEFQDLEKWEKMIPHEISEFDDQFKSYKPSEIDQLIAGLQNKIPFTQETKYYVFDKSLNKITPVYRINQALASIYEKMVVEKGINKVNSLMNEVFPELPQKNGPLMIAIDKKELLDKINSTEGNNIILSIAPNTKGIWNLNIEKDMSEKTK